MTRDTPEGPPTTECLACGRNTGVGTRLFASRKRGRDKLTGETGWLCYACQEGTAGLGGQHSVPAAGRYVVVEIGSMQPG